jgi:hypothetical protein
LIIKSQNLSSSDLFLGFDPGGEKRFGVATILGSKVSFGTVSNIREAVDWTVTACNGSLPSAAGIDTILHWGKGRSGFRNADRLLREKYPATSGSVMAPNSLYGAMTIGGVGIALELNRIWPDLLLNETHPKVLYYAITKQLYPRKNLLQAFDWFTQLTQIDLSQTIPSEDEFDAILSAWATREALVHEWNDLAHHDDHHIFPINGARYLWPDWK